MPNQIPPALSKTLLEQLRFIYSADKNTAADLHHRLLTRLEAFQQEHPELAATPTETRYSQRDAILITYGDQIQDPPRPALQVLAESLQTHLGQAINSVHLLPFYPYSSDDGFSVIDYHAVDPQLGTWADLASLRKHYRLMFDAVINHISAHSDWFKGFQQGDATYANYFITAPADTDVSQVTRPRTHPLLTPFETANGTQHVWTTFSADQIDLNYAEPDVFMAIVEVLLFYVSQGAEFIRLDAIGFLWKELGTSSIHLPQTHKMVQLYRTLLDAVAPGVVLITETNVPHPENIAYFGDGRNEAQMVYNFSLPPLILHTFHSASAEVLQAWAASLEQPGPYATYFNFIASHDGLGLRPAEGLLSEAERDLLAEKTLAHGGQVSYKTNPDGSQSPYELNITLFDALSNPHSDEPESRKIDRFMASQAIMLALAGVPGIYVHSLVGSANNLSGLAETGRARTINREKWAQHDLDSRLSNPTSRAAQVLTRYKHLLNLRKERLAFHPNAEQKILQQTPAIFAVLRTAPSESNSTEQVLALHNVTAETQHFSLSELALGPLTDLLTAEHFPAETTEVELAAYQVRWLMPSAS